MSRLRYVSWGSPVGWLIKYVIMLYWRDGVRGASLSKSVRNHFPTLNDILGADISDAMIHQRGDKGSRIGHETEWPDKNKKGRIFEKKAKQIVKENLRYDTDRAIEIAEKINEDTQVVTIEEDNDASLLYVCGMVGSTNCCIGMTGKKKSEQRVSGFRKGDIDDKMQTVAVFRSTRTADIESELKQMFDDYHMGNERFRLRPHTMIDVAQAIARLRGYDLQEVPETEWK